MEGIEGVRGRDKGSYHCIRGKGADSVRRCVSGKYRGVRGENVEGEIHYSC